MQLGSDWLARFLAGIFRRESNRLPLGKSRLDREAERIELGCALFVFALIGALFYWLYHG